MINERTPPREAWFVIEVDIDHDRDDPLYAAISGPFPSREKAEHERDEQQAAWEEVIAERGDDNPYDFKGWDIVEKHITDQQINRLNRQDEESHQIMQDAANAVAMGLLADEDHETR